jgi:hypothetical protein
MPKFSRFWFVLLIAASTCILLPQEALADRIDGEWCLANSHFQIDGPTIITPGGNTLRGSYSRHGFVYTVPTNEPGAGSEIVMVLLNEETVQLSRGGSPASEIWRRCKVTS